jgi:hypothetical protein
MTAVARLVSMTGSCTVRVLRRLTKWCHFHPVASEFALVDISDLRYDLAARRVAAVVSLQALVRGWMLRRRVRAEDALWQHSMHLRRRLAEEEGRNWAAILDAAAAQLFAGSCEAREEAARRALRRAEADARLQLVLQGSFVESRALVGHRRIALQEATARFELFEMMHRCRLWLFAHDTLLSLLHRHDLAVAETWAAYALHMDERRAHAQLRLDVRRLADLTTIAADLQGHPRLAPLEPLAADPGRAGGRLRAARVRLDNRPGSTPSPRRGDEPPSLDGAGRFMAQRVDAPRWAPLLRTYDDAAQFVQIMRSLTRAPRS